MIFEKFFKVRDFKTISNAKSCKTEIQNQFQEIMEWARQIWRWTIGTAEIFHYFCIKWPKFSFFSGIRYGLVFSHYYGFVLCGMALFSLSSLISTNIFNSTGVCAPTDFLPNVYLFYIPLFALGFAFFVFMWCFFLDSFASRSLLKCVFPEFREEVFFPRNVLHWLSTPFVLLAYSFIGYFAICELAVRGKKVCTHGASKKVGLSDDIV